MALTFALPAVAAKQVLPVPATVPTQGPQLETAPVSSRAGVVLAAAAAAVAARLAGGQRRKAVRRAYPSVVARAAAPASVSQVVATAQGKRPRVAVVGAGWGGLGAAKALCENGCDVILLDAAQDVCKGQVTPTGKPFETGTRGFWHDYPNLYALVNELGMSENDVFTAYTESSFYGPQGLEAQAPVFSGTTQLPSPLGQVFASFSRFKRLPLKDRLSISGLLLAMLDYNRDEATFEAYDRMTAHELFIRCRVTKRLVDDFLRPTLLVGLFKPPEELSAAVTMELLYFYALAHQTSFDVRWLKKGTVGETLQLPVVQRLTSEFGLDVRGGCFVSGLQLAQGRVSALRYKRMGSQVENEVADLDAVVLALGAGGMRSVMKSSPQVAKRCPTLAAAGGLGGIDVIAVRIWLDKVIPTETPANVLSRFEGLRGAGGTFFMLDQIQPDQKALWGGEEPKGSVLSCDFYNSGGLMSLSDEDIVDLLVQELLPAAIPAFASAKPVDSYVRRYPAGVTWFAPGSYRSRPTLETPIENLVCAGDWVRLGDREHGAKGLCQERAWVTGLEAANSLARRGLLGVERRRQHDVIPIREDEPQVKAGQAVRQFVGNFLGPRASPWVR